MSKYKIIIGGGGTGGHIFPAVSIADAIKRQSPETEILFVGAKGRMEMERVPAAGYNIKGLPVAGFQRKFTLKNVSFFFKLFASMLKARKIVRQFKPDIVVGVGGYASGPIVKAANAQGVPSVIQEQNSYAGVTNKLLAKQASLICVAYEGMETYFPEEKILLTGNPIRKGLSADVDRTEALNFFGLKENIPVVLIIGGSLGAQKINESIFENIDKLSKTNVQLIWQAGKRYYSELKEKVDSNKYPNITLVEFISRMDYAYSAANIIVSRAGAGTISELCVIGKPTILIPSPNVSEDHQTKNANALVNKKAAVMVTDVEASSTLIPAIMRLIGDTKKQEELSANIKSLAKTNADDVIAENIIKLIKNK